MEKRKTLASISFYRRCIPLFVNVYLEGKLKVIYEVSQREDYFKKRLRENITSLNGTFWEASHTGGFRSFQRVKISARAVLQTFWKKKR